MDNLAIGLSIAAFLMGLTLFVIIFFVVKSLSRVVTDIQEIQHTFQNIERRAINHAVQNDLAQQDFVLRYERHAP